MHGNVICASSRAVAAAPVAHKTFGPHPIDMFDRRRRFELEDGSDITGGVAGQLCTIRDCEIMRFGCQKQRDVVEESRRIVRLSRRRPRKIAISRYVDRNLKVV